MSIVQYTGFIEVYRGKKISPVICKGIYCSVYKCDGQLLAYRLPFLSEGSWLVHWVPLHHELDPSILCVCVHVCKHVRVYMCVHTFVSMYVCVCVCVWGGGGGMKHTVHMYMYRITYEACEGMRKCAYTHQQVLLRIPWEHLVPLPGPSQVHRGWSHS